MGHVPDILVKRAINIRDIVDFSYFGQLELMESSLHFVLCTAVNGSYVIPYSFFSRIAARFFVVSLVWIIVTVSRYRLRIASSIGDGVYAQAGVTLDGKHGEKRRSSGICTEILLPS
jgi:hypothetical protein